MGSDLLACGINTPDPGAGTAIFARKGLGKRASGPGTEDLGLMCVTAAPMGGGCATWSRPIGLRRIGRRKACLLDHPWLCSGNPFRPDGYKGYAKL